MTRSAPAATFHRVAFLILGALAFFALLAFGDRQLIQTLLACAWGLLALTVVGSVGYHLLLR